MSSSSPSVFISRRVPHSGIDLLKKRGFTLIQHDSDSVVQESQLQRAVKDCSGIFCLLTDRINEKLLENAGPQLKTICTMSVGYDHIDIDACKRRGIKVGYTPDVLTSATAELTVALLLATSRRLIEGAAAVKNGEWGTWRPTWMCGPSLEGSTVGVVGLGRIGSAVHQRLMGFGVRSFLYCGHRRDDVSHAEHTSFDDLLSRSDFVIACCALTEETRGMFNDSAFSRMKPTATFINTSRGGVVDQDALYRALQEGRIGRAGLDVTTPEPLPVDHPLLTLSNCVVLPHIASATTEARSSMSLLTAQNIIAAIEGGEMPARLV